MGTGGSYYGKQQLHYMNTKGDTAMVGLPKEGPIYSTVWAPSGAVFAVVYGFMPAKATMFDLKGEPVFDFGTGPRNCAMFNPNHAKEIKEASYQGARGILADPQREKKARKVMDKLAKISKLKEEVAGGKQLEKNQLEMISKEK